VVVVTEFEILDEVDFGDDKPEAPQKALKAPVVRVKSHDIKPPSQRSTSFAEGYRPVAGKPRIYEVVIETVDYNKSGTKINYSHKIKYPGHEEFFNEGT
jgi:hypothetical protein